MSEKILEYFTACGSDAGSLDKEVNRFIQKGWQPFGSPYMNTGNRGEFFLMQAMVKYAE